MPADVSELAPLVEETATRLRSVQADLADAEEQLRLEHIAEEVSDAMRGLPPDDREEFLKLLSERFPSWDEGVRATPMPVPTPSAAAEPRGRSDADSRELKDPAWVVDRLIKLCANLDAEQRQLITARLVSAGLGGSSGADWPADAQEKFIEDVFGGKPRGIDAGRVLLGAATLSEFVVSIEKVVARAWLDMAPKGGRSAPRRRPQMQTKFADFASGDPEVNVGELKNELEELRKLTAGVILAISRAGDFAWRQLTPILPDEVERTVRENKEKRALEAKEVAYWRKYRELCEQALDKAMFESNLMRELGEQATQYLQRTR